VFGNQLLFWNAEQLGCVQAVDSWPTAGRADWQLFLFSCSAVCDLSAVSRDVMTLEIIMETLHNNNNDSNNNK